MTLPSFFDPVRALYSLLRGGRLSATLIKGFQLWRRGGLTGVLSRLRWHWQAVHGYRQWVQTQDTLRDSDYQLMQEGAARLRRRPLITIVMPTYNSPERWLRTAIESVLGQIYPDWELCVADDASTEPHVRRVLQEYQRLDKRIRIDFRECNGHISAASNSALALATGEFVALLDHDDELPVHALYMVALALESHPELNMIYSDEDKIDLEGNRFGPYFKPDWNPDLLTAQNLVSHLGVYRTDIVRAVGGFREKVEGCQDWDLALRVAERVDASTIYHIAHVLYHWRAVPGSTAITHEEKSYVTQSSQQVVQDHFQRINLSVSVEPAFSSFVLVRYAVPAPTPLVSIILVGDSGNVVELHRLTRYPALEVILCARSIDGTLAAAMNSTATQARGELLCFLDSALLPKAADWLDELVGQATRPEIGAVGPMQVNADGVVENALSVLCSTSGTSRVSWSFYRGLNQDQSGVAGRAALRQNVSILAVGCVMLRAETFQMLSGFDAEGFPNTLFEFDLCLRLVQAGYRNVWTPYTGMVSTGAPRTCLDAGNQSETYRFRTQWREFIDHDPASNPNLICGGEWPFPVFQPHTERPWKIADKD